MSTAHPDRPPPHPTSPFRWLWDDRDPRPYPDRPAPPAGSPTWFDLSHVWTAADRVAHQPENPPDPRHTQ